MIKMLALYACNRLLVSKFFILFFIFLKVHRGKEEGMTQVIKPSCMKLVPYIGKLSILNM